jgi:hypothetical protein
LESGHAVLVDADLVALVRREVHVRHKIRMSGGRVGQRYWPVLPIVSIERPASPALPPETSVRM